MKIIHKLVKKSDKKWQTSEKQLQNCEKKSQKATNYWKKSKKCKTSENVLKLGKQTDTKWQVSEKKVIKSD